MDNNKIKVVLMNALRELPDDLLDGLKFDVPVPFVGKIPVELKTVFGGRNPIELILGFAENEELPDVACESILSVARKIVATVDNAQTEN